MAIPQIEVIVRPDGSLGVKTIIRPESIVQQQFAEETDINVIMDKFQRGIPVSHIARTPGSYTEGTPSENLHSMSYEHMLNAQVKARRAYEALPQNLKDRFGSAEALLRFLEDPSNGDEAAKLGLVDIPVASPKRDDDSNDNAIKGKGKGKSKPTPSSPPSESPQD